MSGSEDRVPVEDFKTINEELKKYSEKLSTRKQIIVANKIDALQDERLFKDLEELAKKENIKIFKVSAATGEGLKELFKYVSEIVKTLPREDIVEGDERVVYTLKDDKDEFEITRENGEFIVQGPAIERIKNANIKELVMTNTIPLTEGKKIEKIKVLDIAPLFVEAIKRINEATSIGELFE